MPRYQSLQRRLNEGSLHNHGEPPYYWGLLRDYEPSFQALLIGVRWLPGQPAGGDKQNCMQLRWKDAMWDDTKCEGTRNYYVCEK